MRKQRTGDELCVENPYANDPLPVAWVSILQRWLGPLFEAFTPAEFEACWTQILQDATDHNDEADYDRVAAALAEAG